MSAARVPPATPPVGLGGAPSAFSVPGLTDETFEKFRALIYEKTGIHMRDGKQILIANRLRKRMAAHGLRTFEEYYALITSRNVGEEMSAFIDAVSTNETYFFREGNHFTALTNIVFPELFKSNQRLRLWSAGCSTGEEVYTLRIVADQAAKAAGLGRSVEIVGTDISTTVIARAQEGIYRERALRLVPPEQLQKYFHPVGGGAYQVADEARARVDFRVHNLFTDKPPWDRVNIIFCRNVMIYFDKPTQAKLVDGIFAGAIHPDGYLFIGHSESISGFTKKFAYCSALKAPIYRRKKEEAT
jgi:chemotaxis protein methyltransferase CheR